MQIGAQQYGNKYADQTSSKLMLAETNETQNNKKSAVLKDSSSSVCNTTLLSGSQTLNQSKRRSFAYNEASGQMERVIRKRKRKTTSQLDELATSFNTDPHWSKEMLLQIALKTNLTEAQVYKWGWD